MGALYARVAGNTNATTGMPTNCLVLPEAVEPGLKLGGNFETGALPTLTSPGDLGPAYAAFDPSGGDQLKKNLQLKISTERFEDRRNSWPGSTPSAATSTRPARWTGRASSSSRRST